jgi:hypothetical protein
LPFFSYFLHFFRFFSLVFLPFTLKRENHLEQSEVGGEIAGEQLRAHALQHGQAQQLDRLEQRAVLVQWGAEEPVPESYYV